jgi:TP901 family phage tail tape measure protein
MAALEERARSLGATTVFTATQAAEGMQFLTLAGFNALEVFQAIGPALQLAQAGALGLGQAADIVSNIMAGFSIEASRTSEVVDALAFVASRTNTNIQQLGEAMKFVAPVAGAIGVAVEETAAALGILGNSGLQASLAGTSLRRVFSGLLNPSKEATKVLSGMNLEAQNLVERIGKPGGLNEVVHILADAGLGAAEAFTLFGQRGAPGILSLINQREKLGDMNIAMQDIAGTAATMAQVMTDNLGGDARLAVSALQEGILQLGEAGLTEFLRDTVQGFGGFIRGLTNVKINMVTASDAMKAGVKNGEAFKENIVAIKRALVVFTTFLLRRTVVALATTVVQLAAGTAAWITYGSAVATVTTLSASATAGLAILRAALISTGIGAAVVLVGYLASLLLVQDDLKESNVETARSYDDLTTQVGIAAFNFDELTAKERELQVVNVELKRSIDQLEYARLGEEIEQTKMAMENKAAAVKKLADAQAILTQRNIIGSEAEQQAAKSSREVAILVNDRILAQSALDSITRQLAQGSTLELEAAQAALGREIELGTQRLAIYDLMQKDTSLTLAEATRIIKENTDARKDAAAQLQRETGLTIAELETVEALIKKYDKAASAQVIMAEGYELLAKNLATLLMRGEGASEAVKTLIRTMQELGKAMGKDAAKAAAKLADDIETVQDKIAKLKAGTDKVKLATVAHVIEMRNLRREMILNEVPIELQAELLQELNKAHIDNIDTMKNACKETEELTGCMDENAKAMDALWDQAMRNIQDAFADAFRNIGSGFDDFADSLLDAFKDLLANMAAQAAINNIFGGGGGFFNDFFGGLSGGFGGGGGGGGSSGGGASGAVTQQAGDQIGDALGSAISGSAAFEALAFSAATFYEGAATFLSGGGTSAQIGSVNATAGAGAAAAGGVIGAISGAVVDAILGSRGDPLRGAIFATIGGVIGSIWGAPGALIGGAIGGLVDNLIGGAQELESATLSLSSSAGQISAETERVVSTQRSFFRGRKFKTTTENVTAEFQGLQDVFVDFVDSLVNAAAALGGSADGFVDDFSLERELNIKGKSQDVITRMVTDFMNDLMGGAIDEFLRDVTGLEDHVMMTLQTFAQGIAQGVTTNFDAATAEAEEYVAAAGSGVFSRFIASVINQQAEAGQLATQGTARSSDEIESFQRALASLVTISTLLDADLVMLTSDAIEDANKTAFESYGSALSAYRDVIAEYDGSLMKLEELALATSVITELQAGLIAVYQQVGDEISALFQGSAQTIREALLSEEELYNLRRSQIDDLIEQAAMTTDPAELSALAAEINRLGLDAFNLLSEDQRAALGPEFVEFFEGLDDLFGDQIAEGISTIVQDQADLDVEVANKMLEVAEAMLVTTQAATDLYGVWLESLEVSTGGGGGYRELQR